MTDIPLYPNPAIAYILMRRGKDVPRFGILKNITSLPLIILLDRHLKPYQRNNPLHVSLVGVLGLPFRCLGGIHPLVLHYTIEMLFCITS